MPMVQPLWPRYHERINPVFSLGPFEAKCKQNVAFFLGSVRGVPKGRCQLAATDIGIRVNESWGKSCKRPTLRKGETHALPLEKLNMKVLAYDLPVVRVRICNFLQIWDKLSALDASYLDGSHCSGPRPSSIASSPSARVTPRPGQPVSP